MNSKAEWEVSDVIDFKVDLKYSFLYLIHWKDPWDNISESLKFLSNTSEVLKAFHCSCSHKLKLKTCELNLKSFNDEEN